MSKFPNNEKAIEVFSALAEYMTLQNEAWRANSYKKVVQLIEDLDQDVTSISNLQSLPGVGKSLEAKIQEIIMTGTCKKYEEIKDKLPPATLKELEKIPNVGPKTAFNLWKQYGVQNLVELKQFIEDNIISDPDNKLKDGIEFAMREMERIPIGFALPLITPIIEAIRGLDYVERANFAGSVRRMKPTVRDADIIVQLKTDHIESPTSSSASDIVTDIYASDNDLPSYVSFTPEGEQKARIILQGDLPIQIDILICSEEHYDSKLLYFTGCKEFNIETRKLAKRKGCKLSEYGLFDSTDEESIFSDMFPDEKEILEALDIPYIPPMWREVQIANWIRDGEYGLIAELTSKYSKMAELNHFKGDLHIHTHHDDGGSDGSRTIRTLVEQAKEINYNYIGISDHSSSLAIAKGLGNNRVLEQADKIYNLRGELDFQIYHGIELEIKRDGSTEDLKDETIERLDYVILAIHTMGGDYTKRFIEAMKRIHNLRKPIILAHLTGRIFGRRAPVEADYDSIFEVAKEVNALIEINSQPERLDIIEELIPKALQYGLNFVVTSDTHDDIEPLRLGLMVACRGAIERSQIVNTNGIPFSI